VFQAESEVAVAGLRGGGGGLVRVQRGLHEATAAPPGDVLGVEDPPDVRLGVAFDAVPGLGRGQECLLEEVLGEVGVTGQQVRRAGERLGAGAYELVELRLTRV
jgi:hypothetical protein